MASFRVCATHPFLCDMRPPPPPPTWHPPPERSPPPAAYERPERSASPEESKRSSSSSRRRPAPEADSDDDGGDGTDMMDLWESRKDCPGGMLEALEKINEMLERPELEAPPDARAPPSLAQRIDVKVDAGARATAAALGALSAALAECADARRALAPPSPERAYGLGSLERDVRARTRSLFRVADPHSDGKVAAADLEQLMERCGMDGAARDAAFAAFGDGDYISEEAFVAACAPHVEPLAARKAAAKAGSPTARHRPEPSPRRRSIDESDKPRRSKSRSYIDGLMSA